VVSQGYRALTKLIHDLHLFLCRQAINLRRCLHTTDIRCVCATCAAPILFLDPRAYAIVVYGILGALGADARDVRFDALGRLDIYGLALGGELCSGEGPVPELRGRAVEVVFRELHYLGYVGNSAGVEEWSLGVLRWEGTMRQQV
jgi:hypothetical protein